MSGRGWAANADKPARLLTTGRVHVPELVRVVVDGDTGRRVVERHGEMWECSCPGFAFRGDCAHRDAVRRITAPPPEHWRAP